MNQDSYVDQIPRLECDVAVGDLIMAQKISRLLLLDFIFRKDGLQ